MAGGLKTRLVVVLAVVVTAAGTGASVARSAGTTRTLEVGDVFIVKGQSGRLPGATRHAVGAVTVTGSWNGGAWVFVTRTHTDATGHYRFTVKPVRRGRLELRITPPDREQHRFVLHVV